MSQNEYIYCPHCKNTLIFKKIDNEKVKTCSNCGFIFWDKPKPVVSILIHKDNKVLMLQRSSEPFKDYWVLPGGFVNTNETAEKAIQRETKEEIGLEIDEIGKIIGTYIIDNDPRGVHLDIIFSGSMQGEIKLSKEDKKWEYFSLENLPDKIAYKHREAIKDWYNINND